MKALLPKRAPSLLGVLGALTLALFLGAGCTQSAPPIPETDLVQIDDLARLIADSTAARPMLLHVGFAPLYRSGHIPGSRYVGAGSRPEGLANLREVLNSVPADQPVVLYCGCCPWQDCPNVRPAYHVAKQSGHSNVRVLYVTGNLERDWTAKGLPTAQGE